MLLYGVLLLVVLFCMPEGIVPTLRAVGSTRRTRWRTS
jgi:ABC-type branched-subunit amino acid transport system permease subunit